jgi:hypothetical protein
MGKTQKAEDCPSRKSRSEPVHEGDDGASEFGDSDRGDGAGGKAQGSGERGDAEDGMGGREGGFQGRNLLEKIELFVEGRELRSDEAGIVGGPEAVERRPRECHQNIVRDNAELDTELEFGMVGTTR